ncbi:MAG: component of SufBCD complex [Cognatishimia sp.]|uniref:component of SufBCD complex n=1 Tax=Cognatishimia sp. 1_MG-2023 TaxID=3062642 RepID=UPI0026E3378F|nr:component of SufBCD complex [Cognatishimia sp. 1_MG-2023]MDO6725439.1 component of SufBCD complex [Cognatishimia sp. 1_MG-2023]
MDWYTTIIELIDLRSFSNLWFWIMLAVIWSSATHWILGVPYDLVLRARRQGGQHEADFEDLVRINVSRLMFISNTSGLWMTSFGCFVLAILSVLGFYYRVEFAQAVFLIFFPMSFVGLLTLAAARGIQADDVHGDELYRRFARHRVYVQLIGIIAIFVSSLWGMYQNFSFSPLN